MRYSAYVNWKKINFLVLFFLGLVLIFSRGALAEEEKSIDWQRQGYFLTRFYQDAKEETPVETQQDIETRLRLENKIELKNWNALIQLNAEGQFEYFIQGGQNSESISHLLLQEAYFQLRGSSYSISLGRQLTTWGKLDNVVVLDRFSPQDYRHFILYDKQERKMPQAMLKFDYFGDDFDVEAVFAPFFEPSKVWMFDSDWAVYDQLKASILEGPYSAATKDVIMRIRTEEREKLIDQTLDNMQCGLRWRQRLDGADVAFYYMYVNNSLPGLREKTANGNILKRFLNFPNSANLAQLLALVPSDDDLTLIEEHPRTQVFGIDAETTLGAYGLRGELAATLGQPYLRQDFSYVRKDTLVFGLGLDHTTANNLYYNIQLIETIILDYEPLFPEEEFGHQFTATLTKEFLRGRLLLGLKHAYNISYGDWMLNPKLTYKFKGGLEATLAGFIFNGQPFTLFGRYARKDLFYLQIKYSF
jgi:hypothetical protein